MAKVRLSIEMSKDVADLLETLAADEETTKIEIVRRALSVLKAYKQQKARGRTHIGFAADPSGLDAELVGILDR
jgi:predicted transcriptional regulator